jgi:2-iminobutanoate/2-iminopropanoate deaminase
MEKIEIATAEAPKAFGIFSQGIQAGNLIFVSGQVAKNAAGELVGKNDIRAQTRQCLENLKAVVESTGAGLDDVVKVTIFVADMNHLGAIHEVRATYFRKPYPASTLVQVSRFTSLEYLIEIEAVAVVRAES